MMDCVEEQSFLDVWRGLYVDALRVKFLLSSLLSAFLLDCVKERCVFSQLV